MKKISTIFSHAGLIRSDECSFKSWKSRCLNRMHERDFRVLVENYFSKTNHLRNLPNLMVPELSEWSYENKWQWNEIIDPVMGEIASVKDILIERVHNVWWVPRLPTVNHNEKVFQDLKLSQQNSEDCRRYFVTVTTLTPKKSPNNEKLADNLHQKGQCLFF